VSSSDSVSPGPIYNASLVHARSGDPVNALCGRPPGRRVRESEGRLRSTFCQAHSSLHRYGPLTYTRYSKRQLFLASRRRLRQSRDRGDTDRPDFRKCSSNSAQRSHGDGRRSLEYRELIAVRATDGDSVHWLMGEPSPVRSQGQGRAMDELLCTSKGPGRLIKAAYVAPEFRTCREPRETSSTSSK